MSVPKTPPANRVDLSRRDTEIAVAAFRTLFLLLVVSSPQFLHARGMGGDLLIAATIAAALYNALLFLLHVRRLSFPRIIIVTVDTILISLWIYFAGTEGERFFVMYFAVVIVAGIWFRRGGALAVAVFASVIYSWAVSHSPLPAGATRLPPNVVGIQILFLLMTAGIATIATAVYEREREELVLSRAVIEQHRQRMRIAQYVDQMVRPRRIPPTPGLDVAFRFRPAGYGISGDYYQLIPLGERRWGIALADVRAKQELGLSYLSLFTEAVRLTARRETSPARLLAHMNQEVVAAMAERNELETFIGMAYVTIDLDTGRMTYANAGIEPGVFVPTATGEIVSLPGSGIVLGVTAEARYQEETRELRTGDTLILFTDGVTEAFDSRNRELGREAFIEQVRGALDAPTAEAVANSLYQFVLEYARGATRRDDITLLVLRVTAADVGGPGEPSAV